MNESYLERDRMQQNAKPICQHLLHFGAQRLSTCLISLLFHATCQFKPVFAKSNQ